MQRLLSLKRGSESLKNHCNTIPGSIQSICSKTLPRLSKTNPNPVTTLSSTHQLRHFSSHFSTASRAWLPQKYSSDKIYGFVSNSVIVKGLFQTTLWKTTGKGLVDSRVGIMRSLERNPSFQGRLRGWKSWLGRQDTDKVVLGLILANVAVFMLWQIADQHFMLKHFTISVDNFKSGRVHTLVTSAFSHIDTVHLISNMIGLYFFGTHIGSIFGPEFVLKLYLAGAIVGSIFYLVHHAFMEPTLKNRQYPSTTPGLGASGAVNAIMLLDIFLFPKNTILLEFIIPVPAILLGIFVIGKDMLRILQGDSQISGSAHLGGAVVAAVTWARIRKGRF